MFKHKLFLIFILTIGFFTTCFSAEVANLPEISIGTNVEYTDKVSTVKCRKWETIEQNKDGFIICKCDDNLMFRNTATLNIVKIINSQGKELVKYSPEHSALSFPLEIGKKWSSEYSGYTADNNASWNSKLSCEVKSFEKLTVAAGTFDTFKIDCEDAWHAGVAGRFSGVAHSTTWYAPQAKEIIKALHREDSRFNQELKSVQLK